MIDEGQMLIASPNPLNPDMEEHLRHRVGIPVRSVFCTPSDVNAAIAKYYPREALQAAGKQAKAGGPKPGAAPAKARAGAEEEHDDAEGKAGPTGTKRKLMIAWIFIMGIVIVYAVYKMLF
jgi:hypothetical protein